MNRGEPTGTAWRRGSAYTDPHWWRLELPGQRGRIVLDWFQDPGQRDLTGWYLRCSWQASGLPSRRLFVDASVEALAHDTESEAAEWLDKSDSIAALSEGLALGRAERIVGAPTRSDRPPALATRYRVLVEGDHAVSLALVFPQLSTWDSDGMTVLEGALDEVELGRVLARLSAIGCRLIVVVSTER